MRLFSMPEPTRRAIGARGQGWVCSHFDQALVAEQTLRLYAEIAGRGRGAGFGAAGAAPLIRAI